MDAALKFFYILLALFSHAVVAQNAADYPLLKTLTGELEVIHYTRNEFKTDSEFWSGCITENHSMIFGNNDGMVIYNGEDWQNLPLPNNSSVRTLFRASDNTIYAGGYNELGKVKMDSLGKYHYESLLKSMHLEDRLLENLEQIDELEGAMIFRFFKELIIARDNQVVHLPAVNDFMHGEMVNGRYYVQDMHIGLLSLDPVSINLSTVVAQDKFPGEVVKGIFPSDKVEELILFMESGRVYKVNSANGNCKEWEYIFKNGKPDQVNKVVFKDGHYYVGTLDSKLKWLDNNAKLLPSLEAFGKLQNNTVLNIISDDDGLWVLLNNGLDYLSTRVSSHQFFNNTRIYDLRIFQDRLYIASNRGLFYADLMSEELQLKEFPGMKGIVWSVSEYNGHLFAGHIKGLYRLEGDKPIQISPTGTWKILPVPERADLFLACGFNGLSLISFKNGKYEFQQKILGFNESTRDIIPTGEPGTYWVCHGFKGVYRIRIDEDYHHVYAVEHYTDENGLQSPFNINVHKWTDQIVFTSNYGIYTFNDETDKFEPYQRLNRILDPTKNTRQIFEQGGKTWFVEDDMIGFFDTDSIEPKELHKEKFTRVRGLLNRGMESILPVNDSEVLVGSSDGIYLFQVGNSKLPETQTLITQVELSTSQKREPLRLTPPGGGVQVPFKTDYIHFEFAAPKLAKYGEVQYQYRLLGLNNEWSGWQTGNVREFNHLSPGSYEFQVRSKDRLGNIAQVSTYPFFVQPEWYQTRLVKIFIILGLLALFLILYHLIKRKLHKENKILQEQTLKEKKLLELEVERLKLQQDKDRIEQERQDLEHDMIRKSMELANYTMQLVNKKDIFNELQSDLTELRSIVKSKLSREKLSDIFRKLQQHKIGEEYMEVFDVNFETVHHDFFEALKGHHANLTKRDLRLCAFINMDLSNKEIAPLLNLSVRGVETLRYRVRKKMSLESEDSLLEYLKGLSEVA